MALPIAKAMDLAKDMKAKGIAGKISMKDPEEVGSSGSPVDDMPEKEPAMSPDMSSIAGDIMTAIEKRDKAGLAKYLMEMVERCSGASEPDADEEGASPSYE
jgi:hypothetical protein